MIDNNFLNRFPVSRDENRKVKYGNSESLDAFHRLRISQPESIFDCKQLYDNAPLLFDDAEISGSGTSSSHSTDTASTTLSVSATTAGERARQTFRRFNYQPGKSQQIMITFVLDKSGGGSGINRKVGFFDDNNGIFLHDDEGIYKIVRRTKVTGSVVDNEVSQSSWNLDKLDGTGESGKTIDFSKSQILCIDFQWLAVGRVRTGFSIDGELIYFHEFLNANSLSVAYMSTPNLPVRYSIENDGTGAVSSIETICCAVISEGGIQDFGQIRYFSTDGTHIEATTSGTIYAIVGIRLKTTHLSAHVELKKISLINATAADYEWLLILNPTVASAITFSDQTNSCVQTGTGNSGDPSTSTLTGGIHLSGGYVKSGGSSGSIIDIVPSLINLGAKIDGTRDEIYLSVKPLTNGSNINGGFQWREMF